MRRTNTNALIVRRKNAAHEVIPECQTPLPSTKSTQLPKTTIPRFISSHHTTSHRQCQLHISQRQPSPVTSPPIQRKHFSSLQLLLAKILWNSASDLRQRRPHDFSKVSLIFGIQSSDASFMCTNDRFTCFDYFWRSFDLLVRNVS